MGRPLPSRDLENALGPLRIRNPWGDFWATTQRGARDGVPVHGPHWDRLWKTARGRGLCIVFGHVTQALNRSRDPETRVSWRGQGAAGLARRRAVIAMVAGGSMLVAPTIPPSAQASMLYTVKILMSVAGFVVFCLGALMYLYGLVKDRTEAAARSRRSADGSERGREVWERPT
jgi:hypothetical protein